MSVPSVYSKDRRIVQCSRACVALRYEVHLKFWRRLSIFVELVVRDSLHLSFWSCDCAFFVPFGVLECLDELFYVVVLVSEILRQKKMSTKVFWE